MTCFSTMAFAAAEVTVGGSYELRSRDFDNTNVTTDSIGSTSVTAGDHRDTQDRIRIDVNAKAGDVKGKLQLNSDFSHSWGTNTQNNTFETYTGPGTSLGFREAWVNFNLPGIPVNVTAGHQLLTLGNGWFFRSMHFGSDAWVIANQTGPNTLAFVNVKVAEGVAANEDDVDAYVLLDVFKLSDTVTVGADLTKVMDRRAAAFGAGEEASLYNLGLNLNAKFGIVGIKAQADMQAGEIKNANFVTVPLPSGDAKFKGNQVVVQGNIGLDPVTVNFIVGRGTGEKVNETDVNQYVNFLDVDPHYTFLYEYKTVTATGLKNTGMANTTVLGAGVSAAATKSLTVAADFYLLKATQAVAINGATDFLGNDATSRDLGMEVDVKVNWKLYDNLAWNWTLGMFKPGDAYDTMVNGVATGADDVTGIQGVLAFKF
jgi:hypothetical protein